MKPQDIGADYVRGIKAGRARRASLSKDQLREEIETTKREIRRVGADYRTGPFLVGYRDGLQGA